MSADYLKEAEEASAIRPQRAEEQPRHDANGQAEASSATRNGDLLGDSRLKGRGNEPVRVALMQDMQQTHGNRAVQRFVQRSSAGTSASPDQEVGARIKNASGNGSSLDLSVQRKLELGIGADLSGVRVHADSEADDMARSVDAVAFTSGQDVFFRDGAYNPGSQEGMHLLAHEAVHTVQQSQGPVEGTPAPGGISISDPSDRHEQQADRAAASIMQGGQSSAVGAAGGGAGGAKVQRQLDGFDGREDELEKKKPEDEEAAVQAMRAGSILPCSEPSRYSALVRGDNEPRSANPAEPCRGRGWRGSYISAAGPGASRARGGACSRRGRDFFKRDPVARWRRPGNGQGQGNRAV